MEEDNSEDTNEAAAVPVPSIELEYDSVKDAITGDDAVAKYLDYADEQYVTNYEYAGDAGLAIWQATKTYLKVKASTVEGDKTYTVSGDVYDVENGNWADEAYYETQWEKLGDDGTTWTPLAAGVQPDSVGTYHLKFSLSKNSVHDAAEDTSIVLKVEKTVVDVVNVVKNSTEALALAGSTFGDLIDANSEYQLKSAKNSWAKSYRGALIDESKTVIAVHEATTGEDGKKIVNIDATSGDASTKFEKNKNYAIVFGLTLADSAKDYYELGETAFLVVVGDARDTYKDFSYSDPTGYKGYYEKAYGTAVTMDEVLATIAADSRIYYKNGDDEIDLKTAFTKAAIDADDDLSVYWTDANGTIITEDPVNAGTYYLVIKYEDSTGTYESQMEEIKVSITATGVIVRPALSTLTATAVPEGYTAGELLNDVTYTLVDASTGANVEFDKDSFWGYSYNGGINTSQAYEPVFEVQIIETKNGKELDPVVLEKNAVLENDANKKYRIVFTGDKAVYDSKGIATWRGSINNSSTDYKVNTGDAVLYDAANVVALTIVAANHTTIDVSAIVAGKDSTGATGKEFATPIELEYTGKSMYANKGEYKVATLSAGDTADLTYSWEEFHANSYKRVSLDDKKDYSSDLSKSRLAWLMDDDNVVFNPPTTEPTRPTTQESAEDAEWIAYNRDYPAWLVWNDVYDYDDVEHDYGLYDDGVTWETITSEDNALEGTHYFNDAENWPAPSVPGIYRLRIDYKDSTHANAPATAYVYYVIHKMNAVAEITGTPSAYADGVTTPKDVINSLQSTDSTDASTYIKVEFYPATVDATTGVATKTDGAEAIELPEAVQKRIEANPGNIFTVERKTTVSGKDVWNYQYNPQYPNNSYYSPNYVLQYVAPGTDSYRLLFNPDASELYYEDYEGDNVSYLYRYYNFYGKATGSHNQELKDQVANMSSAVALTVLESKGTQVYITLDESALTSYEKIYDGKGIDLSAVKATVKTVDGNTDVTATVVPKFRATYTYLDKTTWNDRTVSVPLDQAVHARKYTIEAYTDATAEYRSATAKLSSGSYVIRQKELEIAPTIKSPVYAGNYAYYDTSWDWYPGYIDFITDNVVDAWTIGEITDPVEGDNIVIDTDVVRRYAEVFRTDENLTPDGRTLYSGEDEWGNEASSYIENNGLDAGDLLVSGVNYFVYLDVEKDVYGDDLNEKALETTREDAFGSEVAYSQDYTIKASATGFVPVRNKATVSKADNANQATELKLTTTAEVKTEIADYAYEYTTTIQALSGIPVDNDVTNFTGDDTKKNLLRFNITKPGEFKDSRNYKSFTMDGDFAYAESIENAIKAYGGTLSGNGESIEGISDTTADTITITLDAGLIQEKATDGKVAFDIIWDVQGQYIEHFIVDLSDATLLVDLSVATAPKKVKFNATQKKMAVGETQQLDVKITKYQQHDVIWLGYESSDSTVIMVNDEMLNGKKAGEGIYIDDEEDQVSYDASYNGGGFITALKKGKATISVYACVEEYDTVTGEKLKVKLSETPSAKVTITVTDVAKAKVSKIKAKDTSLVFQYKRPANGYRREYYILEGKAKPADFEAKLAEVKDGDYSEFAYASIGETEYKADGKAATKTGDAVYVDTKDISKLEPNTNYTLYIRNVSGTRKLDDGADVAVSAAGAVKAFKTTKSMLYGLDLTLTEGDYADVAYKMRAYDISGNSYVYHDVDAYQVEFSKKSVTIQTDALFHEKQVYSDENDYISRSLPLTGTDKKTYQAPKLKYFVMNAYTSFESSKPDKAVLKNYAKLNYNGKTYYYQKTNIATINNKGKLTLKGEGYIKVAVIDTVSDTIGFGYYYIDASPDAVNPVRTIKMQSGEMAYLSDFLTYKEGSAQVVDYQGYYDESTNGNRRHVNMFADLSIAEGTDENFKIEKVERYKYDWDEENHWLSSKKATDYLITALASGATKELTVTDKAVAENGGSTATVKLSTVALEPVKNINFKLQSSSGTNEGYIRDDSVVGSFTHSVKGLDLMGSERLTVSDTYVNYIASPFQIKSIKADEVDNIASPFQIVSTEADYSWTYDTSNGALRIRQNLYDGKGKLINSQVKTVEPELYNNKKKTFTYKWSEENLTPMQNYVVGITVLNDDGSDTEVTKEVKKKFKTTNVAASHVSLDTKLDTNKESGVNLVVSTGAGDNSTTLANFPVLTSGNTYSLITRQTNGYRDWAVNKAAIARGSDKLTWKVTNSKVAKLKVKPGTYSAALTALRPGVTEIQITSKVTKKVISRRTVIVGAVANAKAYFGTNEPYSESTNWGYGFTAPDETMLDKDILSIEFETPITVTVAAGERQWFVFEAPAYGEYEFRSNGDNISTATLNKGEKYYMSVSNNTSSTDLTYIVNVKGTMYEEVSGDALAVKAGTTALFYVPETNYYYITYKNDLGVTMYLTAYGDEEDGYSISGYGSASKKGTALKKGGMVEITLSGNNITDGKDYELTLTKRTISDTLTKDHAVSYSLTNPEEGVTEEQWFAFVAPEDGIYRFTVTDDKDIKAATTARRIYTSLDATSSNSVDSGATVVRALDKKDELYFMVQSLSASETNKSTGTIKVEQADITALTADAATPASVTIKSAADDSSNTPVFYSFTPTSKDGVYTVKFAHDDVDKLKVTYATTLGEIKTGSGTAISAGEQTITVGDVFKVNKPVYFSIARASGNSDEVKDVKISVTTKQYTSVTAAATAGEDVTEDGDVYYSFNAPKNVNGKTYLLTLTMPDGATPTVYNETTKNDIVMTQDSKTSTLWTGTFAQTEFTTAKIRVSSDKAGKITAKAEEVSYTTLTAGTESKTEKAAAGTYYYSFAADANDVYAIEVESTGTLSSVTESTGLLLGDADTIVSNKLSKDVFIGKVYGNIIFKVETTAEGDLTFKITQRKATALTVGETTGSIPVGSAGAWYSFTRTEDNYFDFKFEATGTDGTLKLAGVYSGPSLNNSLSLSRMTAAASIEISEATDDTTEGGAYNKINNHLANMQTVYFKLLPADGATAATAAKITVSKREYEEITVGTSKSFSLTKNYSTDKQAVWFKFTAPTADSLNVVLKSSTKSGDDYAVVQVSNAANLSNAATTDIARTTLSNLSVGATKWFQVTTESISTDITKVEGALELLVTPVKKLTLGTETKDELTYDGPYNTIYEFQADADGYYDYLVTADKVDDAEVSADYVINIKSSTSNSWSYYTYGSAYSTSKASSIYLKQYEKIRFIVSSPNAAAEKPVTVHLTVSKTSIDALTLGTAKAVELDSYGKQMYSLAIEEDGLYTVKLEGTMNYVDVSLEGRNGEGYYTYVWGNTVDSYTYVDGYTIYYPTGTYFSVIKDETSEESYLLSAGTTLYVTASGGYIAEDVTDKSNKANLTVSKATVTKLAANSAGDISIPAAGGDQWFYFKADTANTYTINAPYGVKQGDGTGTASIEAIYTAKENSNTGYHDYNYYSNGSASATVTSVSGRNASILEYYIKVAGQGSDTESTTAVIGKIAVTAPEILTSSASFTLNPTGTFRSKTYKFTVDEDADDYQQFYTFTFTEGDSKKHYTVKVNNNGTERSFSTENLSKVSVVLTRGETYNITVSYGNTDDNTKDTTGTISVAKTTGAALASQTIGIGAVNEQEITVAKNSEMWVKFNTPAKRYYTLTLSDFDNGTPDTTGSVRAYLETDEDSTQFGEMKYRSITISSDMYINADNTVYVRLLNTTDKDTKGKIKVS